MGDTFEGSEQESSIGEEASSKEDSKDISNAYGSEIATVEDSLDERTTDVGEG